MEEADADRAAPVAGMLAPETVRGLRRGWGVHMVTRTGSIRLANTLVIRELSGSAWSPHLAVDNNAVCGRWGPDA